MELYFNMETVLWKTFLIARQIYMYINLVMKCQQLQMKLLYSQNSNKNILSFKRLLILWVLNVPRTEFLIGCLCKKQTWSLFSAIPKSRHQHGHLGISIDIADIFFSSSNFISKNGTFTSNTTYHQPLREYRFT